MRENEYSRGDVTDLDKLRDFESVHHLPMVDFDNEFLGNKRMPKDVTFEHTSGGYLVLVASGTLMYNRNVQQIHWPKPSHTIVKMI